jgi:tRNA(Ile)-lysidine synthetase-like protein
MRLSERVWNYCLNHGLLAPGERVVLGVSGGPDSLCLLDGLHGLAAAQRLVLIVAHLDHGLRPGAAADAAFVRGEAAARGLACVVERVDTAGFAAARGISLEDAGRRLRYAFLARVAREHGAERVAVAHTADDQAETVLMHFLRGAGLDGLSGMKPKAVMGELAIGDWVIGDWESAASAQMPIAGKQAPVALIRPLLGETRSAVVAYCAARGLQPREDETNADPRFWRNKVRHEVLPFLEQYNPNLRATLARTAEVLSGEQALAQAAVDALMESTGAAGGQAPGQVAWDRGAWQALSLPEQRALLRRGIERLHGAVRDVDFGPLDAAARFGRTAAPGQGRDLAAGLRLAASGDRLVLTAGAEAPALTGDGPLLDEAGCLSGGWRLEVETLAKGAWDSAAVKAPRDWEAFVDAGRVTEPLKVRGRQAGERFQPLGLGGHRDKVSDFMINARVPAELRDRWPLVACGGAVVWLAGLRLDERFRVTPASEAVLRLRFTRAEAKGER